MIGRATFEVEVFSQARRIHRHRLDRLQPQQSDLMATAETHRRTPPRGSTVHIERHFPNPVQARYIALYPVNKEGEGKVLTPVGVTTELQIKPEFRSRRRAVGLVCQQEAEVHESVSPRSLKLRVMTVREHSTTGIRDTRDQKPNSLVFKNTRLVKKYLHPEFSRPSTPRVNSRVVVMIAGHKPDSMTRREPRQRLRVSSKSSRISVGEVPGHSNQIHLIVRTLSDNLTEPCLTNPWADVNVTELQDREAPERLRHAWGLDIHLTQARRAESIQ
jgi:hypothetical protein